MYRFWRYFLALEEDLIQITRYIELDKKNFTTFSIEILRLYLAVCSEIDVVAKVLCHELGETTHGNIDCWRKIIVENYSNLPTLKISIPLYGLEFVPWRNWGFNSPSNPCWWKYYNKVKHQRDEFFEAANLEHVLNALSGLMVINLYYLKTKLTVETSIRKDQNGTYYENNDIEINSELQPKLLTPPSFNTRMRYDGNPPKWIGKLL